MADTLSIVAIVLLLSLVAVSLMKQRAGMNRARVDEDARTAGAGVQRERSMRRRAEAHPPVDGPAA